MFRGLFSILTAIMVLLPAMVMAAGADSTGAIGEAIKKLTHGVLSPAEVMAILGVAGPVAYRMIQKLLQKIPTKWRWVNNQLTAGLINRMLAILFGKTVLLYNMYVEAPAGSMDEAIKAAKNMALGHLGREGGLLQDINKKMKNSG